jgi:hypothetical protein
MTKNLYKVSWIKNGEVNLEKGQFRNFIVCAKDETQAKNYHPDGDLLVQATFNYKCSEWINPLDIDQLEVEKIAEKVHSQVKIGVVGHTFNY